MKSNLIFKTILLALPAIFLLYVFLIRDMLDAGPGTGGGSYDLTKMYTLVGIGLYLLILNLVFLIQDAGRNWPFLLIGVALLIGVVITAVRTF